MKKFMVVTLCEGETHAAFFDTYREASRYRTDAECGMGGYAEIYERSEEYQSINQYRFLES